MKLSQVAGTVMNKVKSNEVLRKNIESASAMVRISKGESEARHMILRGRSVIVQDDAFKAYNAQYAMTGKNSFGEPIIVVESNIHELEDNIIDFLIAHEEGHIALHKKELNNSFSSLARKINALRGKDTKIELEADEYAADVIGYQNAIDALREFSKVVTHDTDVSEINRRIDNLLAVRTNKHYTNKKER